VRATVTEVLAAGTKPASKPQKKAKPRK